MPHHPASGSTNSMFRFFSDKANTTPSFEIESLGAIHEVLVLVGFSTCLFTRPPCPLARLQ